MFFFKRFLTLMRSQLSNSQKVMLGMLYRPGLSNLTALCKTIFPMAETGKFGILIPLSEYEVLGFGCKWWMLRRSWGQTRHSHRDQWNFSGDQCNFHGEEWNFRGAPWKIFWDNRNDICPAQTVLRTLDLYKVVEIGDIKNLLLTHSKNIIYLKHKS